MYAILCAELPVTAPHIQLDLRGKVCPWPTLDTSEAFRRLAPGEVLEVITDYYPARQTIPELIRDLGGTCEMIDEGPTIRFRIGRERTQA